MATTLSATVDTAPTLAAIDTSKVKGRRTVRYESYDDLLADAERMAGTEFHTLGNWSLGQICKHLARSIDMMIDGPLFLLPAPIRLVMSWTIKKRMLRQTVPAGFRLPKKGQALVP